MPDLNAIVQRMIDAGESEENIATVIQFQKSRREPTIGADPNPQSPEVDAQGNRITRNPDGSVKFIQGPGFSGNADTSPDRNVATVGGFGVAPEDILTVPSLVAGAKAIGRGVSNLAGKVLQPDTLRRGAEIVGSPWKEGTKAFLNKGAEMLERRAGAPPVSAPTAAVPTAAEAVAPVAAKVVFNPTKALQAAKDAFATIGETPLRGEASNAMEFIRRGVPPEQAVAQVLKNRPAVVDPAELFNAKFGTLTDDQARAAIDLRNARGQIKTPSAQTAAQRYPR